MILEIQVLKSKASEKISNSWFLLLRQWSILNIGEFLQMGKLPINNISILYHIAECRAVRRHWEICFLSALVLRYFHVNNFTKYFLQFDWQFADFLIPQYRRVWLDISAVWDRTASVRHGTKYANLSALKFLLPAKFKQEILQFESNHKFEFSPFLLDIRAQGSECLVKSL